MCAAITTAAIGVASSAYSIYSGEQQKADAKRAMENLEVPELENPYENMRVSTMGSDLLREEGQRRTASVIDGLRGGGARNMMSAIPKIVAMNNDINQQARKEIDDQMLQREQLIAGYGEKQNAYEENRYQNTLSGLGKLYDVGDHKAWNGIRSGVAHSFTLGKAIDSKLGGGNGDKGGGDKGGKLEVPTLGKSNKGGRNSSYWSNFNSYNAPWNAPYNSSPKWDY